LEQILHWLSGFAGILWAIIALGIMIFFHEFGHFIVAKLSGVGVMKFSLGFGTKLVGRKFGETEYMISALPLGGYVKLLGEEEGEELPEADKPRSFVVQPVWKRFAIVFAGPVFNIILAVILCYIVMLTGNPTPIARVSDVKPGSPAEAAGFKKGDIISSVDGQNVMFWDDIADYVNAHPGKEMSFAVEHAGSRDKLSLNIPDAKDVYDGLGLVGTVMIGARKDGSPAAKAGLRADDVVVAVDGKRVGLWNEMADMIRASTGKELDFTIQRAGQLMHMNITPVRAEDPLKPGSYIGIIGVMPGTETVKVSYGPAEAAVMSVDRTVLYSALIVRFLGRLIGGKEDATQVGGPIAIVQLSERQAKQGFADFVLFMAMLSINLGIINLVPIPVLDGGHLFFLGLEAVMGKPLSMRKREIAQQIGLVLIISLMAIVFGMDILRAMGFLDMWR
jgi:regulator of sigma E protease